MAASYGVYHGPEGIKGIAERINGMTAVTAAALKEAGFGVSSEQFFDTFSGKRGLGMIAWVHMPSVSLRLLLLFS